MEDNHSDQNTEKCWRKYICDMHKEEFVRDLTSQKSLTLDLIKINGWGDKGQFLVDQLIQSPDVEISRIHRIVKELPAMGDLKDPVSSIRFLNLPETVLENIQSNQINTLISIKGSVDTVSAVRPHLYEGVYSCPAGHLNYIKQRYGDQSIPDRCREPNCKYKKLTLERDLSTIIDSQQVTIANRSFKSGEQLLVDLPPSWQNTLKEWDRLTVTGILRYFAFKKSKDCLGVKLYLEAITILPDINIVPLIKDAIRENPTLSIDRQIDVSCKKVEDISGKPVTSEKVRQLLVDMLRYGELMESHNSYRLI